MNTTKTGAAEQETTLKILSHAGAMVKTRTNSIIMDPWLVGSCYWRSWWNYPRVKVDPKELDQVEAVVISHIHWDHWHGPSLKKYFRGKRIIVGDDPNSRSIDDLRKIGFDDVTVVGHGDYTTVGEIKVYFYNFGLLLNDSALVLRTPDSTILNANDAKLAGSSLKFMLSRHGPVDIAMRSHSSANSRVCYSIDGQELEVDDREHYFRSFKLFMDAVKPKYALPFASNHCHLLPEIFAFNKYVSKPDELERYLEDLEGSQKCWEFVKALPGSSWSSATGFNLANQDAFDGYEAKLIQYQTEVRDRLDSTARRENKVVIGERLLDRFDALRRSQNFPRKLRGVKFVLTRPSGDDSAFVAHKGKHSATDDVSVSPKNGEPVVIMPAAVFRDAVLKNMFHHAGISKRCRYVAANRADFFMLQSFVAALERTELLGEASPRYWGRLLLRHMRRWRDFTVYGWALYYRIVRGLPIYNVEEAILEHHSGGKAGTAGNNS